MQTVKTASLAFICLVLLSACGLKGPLYLPEENPEPTTEVKEQDSDEEETGNQLEHESQP